MRDLTDDLAREFTACNAEIARLRAALATAQAEAAMLREALTDWVDQTGAPHGGRMAEPHEPVDYDWVPCPEDETCACTLVKQINAALAPEGGRAFLRAADAAVAFLKEHHDALHMHATHTLDCTGEGCRIRALLLAYEEVRK